MPRMEKVDDGTYAVHFVPDECGPYKVNIKYGDQDVEGSPFTLQAHQIGEVRFNKDSLGRFMITYVYL